MAGYKRIIDYRALWTSRKLEDCAEEVRAEYAWMFGLADAAGSFEYPSTKVIQHAVGAIRPDLTIEKIEQAMNEFQENGLLFVWEAEGSRWGHWVGSTKPGRLPSKVKSSQGHYKVDTPAVPAGELQAYCQAHGVFLKYLPRNPGNAEPEKESVNTRPFTDYAVETYTKSYGRKPTWKGFHYIQFNDLLRHQELSLEDFKLVWDAYISDRDPFVAEKQAHSLAYFCTKFDVYANKAGLGKRAAADKKAGPVDVSAEGKKLYEQLGVRL